MTGKGPMVVVVSPYHLTSREPPAMAALLLAERVVTLIPSPREGTDRAALRQAVERSPLYLRFMQSWEWSVPLWRAGLVTSIHENADPTDDMLEIVDRIESDGALDELRVLMRPELLEHNRLLTELSRDILRAGPDPTFSVPVAAALDQFAARFGLWVARPQPVSVAQRAETRLGRAMFAVAVPVLLQAGGDTIVRARRALAGPLASLRRAMELAARPVTSPEPDGGERPPGPTALAAPLRSAAAAYAEAFDRVLPSLCGSAHEPRAVAAFAALEFVLLPADAVLRASLVAVRTMHGRSGRRAGGAEPPFSDGAPDVVSIIVRPIGAGTRARAR